MQAELPAPPTPTGLGWLGVVGPGVIVLGLSIGSGEFLLGPAVFVRYGLTLLWVTLAAVVLQTIFNMEVMRYTLATGEPVFTGFMRTRPSSTLWALIYVSLYLLQFGWPAFAGTAAGAIFFLIARQLPVTSDAATIYYIGVAIFLACASILLVGRRIVRTLEVLNWILVATTLGSFLIMALMFVSARDWGAGVVALVGFDLTSARFELFPAGADLFLLGALVAYSGAGGVTNIVLSNWARDKGYGMGERAGYIPSAVGGTKVHLAHTGFTFAPDAGRCGAGVDGGASFASTNAACLPWARCSACCSPRFSMSRFSPPAATFKASASALPLPRASARRKECWSAAPSRFSAPGFCSRRSSITSKAWCARSPTSCGPAARESAVGEAATCARCITA